VAIDHTTGSSALSSAIALWTSAVAVAIAEAASPDFLSRANAFRAALPLGLRSALA